MIGINPSSIGNKRGESCIEPEFHANRCLSHHCPFQCISRDNYYFMLKDNCNMFSVWGQQESSLLGAIIECNPEVLIV